jgi:hypothetical protein
LANSDGEYPRAAFSQPFCLVAKFHTTVDRLESTLSGNPADVAETSRHRTARGNKIEVCVLAAVDIPKVTGVDLNTGVPKKDKISSRVSSQSRSKSWIIKPPQQNFLRFI